MHSPRPHPHQPASLIKKKKKPYTEQTKRKKKRGGGIHLLKAHGGPPECPREPTASASGPADCCVWSAPPRAPLAMHACTHAQQCMQCTRLPACNGVGCKQRTQLAAMVVRGARCADPGEALGREARLLSCLVLQRTHGGRGRSPARAAGGEPGARRRRRTGSGSSPDAPGFLDAGARAGARTHARRALARPPARAHGAPARPRHLPFSPSEGRPDRKRAEPSQVPGGV